MTKDAEVVRTYFAKLNLEPGVADMYLALHTHGPQNISELARSSGVERTRIYRLIDALLESNLIEVETRYKRAIIHAAPISNLHILISRREQELQSLQEELGLIERVLKHNSLNSPATRVQFYQGMEGVKQMFWNQTKFKSGEQVSVLYENMQIHTGRIFFERWVEACEARGFIGRSVVSDSFLHAQEKWQAKHNTKKLKNWQGRYVSNDAFPIRHSLVVYDNVTSFFNWRNGEVFGIEMHNQEVADMQRQFFELLWLTAAPIPGKAQPVPH